MYMNYQSGSYEERSIILSVLVESLNILLITIKKSKHLD